MNPNIPAPKIGPFEMGHKTFFDVQVTFKQFMKKISLNESA
jgi:hypothetical protein